jgi:hypothetical protein
VSFPYTFCSRHEREDGRGTKEAPAAFHDKLLPDRYDVAFKITWKALSPVAANPCTTSGLSSCPDNDKKEYAGYNKHWLMVGNRLAISPFTVKSAIANGFANLLGGCYRVITKIDVPDEVDEGQYPYRGGYKRYRVDMSDRSRPGIIERLDVNPADGSRTIEIRPVVEYYYDQPIAPPGVVFAPPPQSFFAEVKERRHKHYIDSIGNVRSGTHTAEVFYYGPYEFGMDLGLRPGDLGKKHWHRFYSSKGSTVKGIIPACHFEASAELRKQVYLGKFKPLSRSDKRPEGGPWYEDLNRLRVGSWVYYQEFDGQVTNIGQNYLFRALFFHEDAVADDFKLCRDMNRLCPRCFLFGMTDETKNDGREAVGYRGRFKASALVNDDLIEEQSVTAEIPFDNEENKLTVSLTEWTRRDEPDKPVCRQFLMPIQGPPKPNKRDIDGYFDPESGHVKGSKIYRHGTLRVADLERLETHIKHFNGKLEREKGKFVYTHRLRNYAAACEAGLEFEGTVGIENGSAEEIAALVMLLEHQIAGHGFKIGSGKAFGLGSMASSIQTVWLRRNDPYRWEEVSVSAETLMAELKTRIPGIDKEVRTLKAVQAALNRLEGMETRQLDYPDKGPGYWNRLGS